jgi:pimeloyl-ACP methyl ester carboxylesterase
MRPESIHPVHIPADEVHLEGDLVIPDKPIGVVLFAHGSGSSRYSTRNRFVAAELRQANLATLLMDLLTAREEEVDRFSANLRFDIGLLGRRLAAAIDFVRFDPRTMNLPIGLFGASTGAAAALVAASRRPGRISAIVSRGGRPDLAHSALATALCPTLLIVGGDDESVIQMNRDAMAKMPGEVRLEIIPGATHLFEEPGALDQVAQLARDFFAQHLHQGNPILMTDGLDPHPSPAPT